MPFKRDNEKVKEEQKNIREMMDKLIQLLEQRDITGFVEALRSIQNTTNLSQMIQLAINRIEDTGDKIEKLREDISELSSTIDRKLEELKTAIINEISRIPQKGGLTVEDVIRLFEILKKSEEKPVVIEEKKRKLPEV